MSLLAGCGQQPRQDENEPSGIFRVQVVRASFPEQQALAKTSNLVITVRNVDTRSIPNLSVTVHGFSLQTDLPGVADRERPQFVINARRKSIAGFPEAKEEAPHGCDTAYVGTWACGPLAPHRERTFRWSVSAVKAGPFRVRWEISGGLDGKARAVDATGARPTGVFVGTVSDAPPQTRVADDGQTVVRGTR